MDMTVGNNIREIGSSFVSQIIAAYVEDPDRRIKVDQVGNHLQTVVADQIAVQIQFHKLRPIAKEL
jgi:hypothetical protein